MIGLLFVYREYATINSFKKRVDLWMKTEKKRLDLLDSLRGFALINMIAYHALYDLVYIFGESIPWYQSKAGYWWQQAICWCFILLSGFCFSMAKKTWIRGIKIFLLGSIISLVTAIIMPQQRVRFGILSFMGVATMLVYGLQPLLKKIPAIVGVTGSFLLFLVTKTVPIGALGIADIPLMALPYSAYQSEWLYPLGFPRFDFFSSDYFPILPWFFLYLTGYFLFYTKQDFSQYPVFKKHIPILSWIGRHSLWIYVLHQPVIYGILWIFYGLFGW